MLDVVIGRAALSFIYIYKNLLDSCGMLQVHA